MKKPPASKRRWVLLILLLLALGAACVAGWWFWSQRQHADRCGELSRLRNLAIGYLETGDYRAEEVLTQLTKMVPDDPVAVRNHAISRLTALLAGKTPTGQDRQHELRPEWLPDLERLQAVEPQKVSTFMIMSQTYKLTEDFAARRQTLRAGLALHPKEAALWYELYDTLKHAPQTSDDPALKAEEKEALEKLAELDPENTLVLLEICKSQLEAGDPLGLKTLAKLRTILTPTAQAMKRSGRSDLMALMDKAEQEARAGRRREAGFAFSPVINVLRPEEWWQSDRRRLTRNHLSYIAFDFLPGNCPRSGLPPEPEPAAISVSFQRTPVALDGRKGDADKGAKPGATPAVHAVAVADFELDDRQDLWVLTDDAVRVLAQPEKFGQWKPAARTLVRAGARGLLLADLDRDVQAVAAPVAAQPADPEATKVRRALACQPGDVDAVAYGRDGVSVLRNVVSPEGPRELVDVPQTHGLENVRDVTRAILADVDHDGDLDLVLTTPKGLAIWGMEGDMQFVDMSARSKFPQQFVAKDFVAVDWDRDADLDVLVVGDPKPGESPAGMLENLRHGQVRWMPLDLIPRSAKPSSIELADIDGNVSWDVLVNTSEGLFLTTTNTFPGESVEIRAMTLVNQTPFRDAIVWDYDNDAHADLVAWTVSGPEILHGGPGNSLKFDNLLPAQPSFSACATADLDNDGDLELIVADQEGLAVFQNEGGNANAWISIKAFGDIGDKKAESGAGGDVNQLAIGSLIEILAGPRYQAQVITGTVTHFGLGNWKPEVIRVVWTNGIGQPIVEPKLNEIVCKRHDFATSCPFLYGWDGEKYDFITDACWAAPLGLRFAESIYATPREWEYLFLRGDQLKPKDGRYSLQMTEELWEATYLDHCELLVVDHPAGTRIVSNEKVGGPELAKFKIHTIAKPRLPVAARDKHGRDVLSIVAKEDEQYFRGFDGWKAQGLTDEHWLELDLGRLDNPQQITLFLTGWMFPTQTSANMRLSQHDGLPPMKPPALWVPDAHGKWQEVQPFMGFPGGKTKTIAVDLSKAFLTDDYRLRIVTSMEFYWDAAWFTADDPPVETRVARLPLSKADLHYRGFSAVSYPPHFGPQHYDYASVSTAPKWSPMGGTFTRYGDVTGLLTAADNRMAIFGSGDEITLEFDVPKAPLPAGWTRDFLLYNNGWDKDCDLNIVSGQQVDPLPFQGMSGYPYGPGESYPDTPATREYLRKYQTRLQNRLPFWRRGLAR